MIEVVDVSVGYAQTRLKDAYSSRATIVIVAVLFMLVHAGYASFGLPGAMFVVMMGWQGVVWAAVRLQAGTLIPQLLAHGVLLLLYPFPMVSAVIVAVLGVLVLPGARPWATDVVRNARMRRNLVGTAIGVLVAFGPSEASGQDRKWTADLTGGYTAMVDNANLRFLTFGGGSRRYLTPRVSAGPELIFMSKAAFCSAAPRDTSADCDGTRDRNLMLTANVTLDVLPGTGPGARRLVPFLVGGAEIMWKRDSVGDGRLWSSDPAFTIGGGLRAGLSEIISTTAEYRLGWELHHRLTLSVGLRW